MKRLIILPLLFLQLFVTAQEKLLSLEDAFLRARTALAAQNLSQLQFFGSTNDYLYLGKAGSTDTWMKGNFKSKTETAFLTLAQLNNYLKSAGFDTASSMPAIRFGTDGWMMSINNNKILLQPFLKQYRLLLPAAYVNKENAEESKAGYVAWVENFNLFVTQFSNSGVGKTIQVTTDGSRNIIYASSVHREEFGINKGTFWSNNGTKLAFYRMDQSMVTDYPIINWSVRPATVDLIKYPMAGDKSHEVTVGVYNTITEKTTWLKTGLPAEQYLTNIAWSPDDRYVYIAVLNRQQNHMWLNQYDANTGEFIKTLFEETQDKYVEPLVPMQFDPNNAAQFIWQSNRDGWNHIYLYDTSGRQLKQLTKGNWEVVEVKGFDRKSSKLFFAATSLSPIDRTLSYVDLKTGIIQEVTHSPGIHGTQVSTDGTTVIDSYSTISNPRTVQLLDITRSSNVSPRLLLQSGDPLKGYAEADLSLFTIKNREGDSIFCRMFKPIHFDPSKKYPVIVYWYGGPHAQLILNNWNGGAGDYWFQYMAERGYVVFSIDTRGSDNRGRAFEQTIFRRLGEAQMKDLEDALNFLTSQSFVDNNRMGLFGWSFGGFLTTDFVLNHPLLFKAAVAGGPVMDWNMYEIMYGERYMDMPQENPEGYEATNLIKQAGKLKGKLLLIHGLQDPVVVQQHSVNFVRACINNGVQVDYMIYPGHEHNVLGKDRVHLFQKITDYFNEHL
jgi:dipeptidyl-peptidase-4